MTMVKGALGAALFGYTILYILQVVFSSFYADLLSPSEVWHVMNHVTAVGDRHRGGGGLRAQTATDA